MITIKSADAALKDYYLDAVNAQLNDNISPFFSAIEKNSENVSGKDVKLAVIRGNYGNVIAGAEDGDLPAPYKNRYAEICVPLKNIYGTIEISDKAIRASRESSGAFVNLINAEMEGLISNAKFNFRRMLFGDGSGYICEILAKESGNKLRVDPARDYFLGMQVDVYMPNEELDPACIGVYVTAVDTKNDTITLSAEVTGTAVGSEIYIHNSRDGEITGFGAMFNDPKFLYGHSKEDPYFMPYKKILGNNLTESDLCDIIDYMEEHFNSKINMIICSYKARKRIAELADSNRRIVNTIDVRTGHGSVFVNDVPVCADKFCGDDVIYFINTDDFALYQLCDWEWLEDEDGRILKQVPGKAAYSATLVKYAELVCRKPYAQAALFNWC